MPFYDSNFLNIENVLMKALSLTRAVTASIFMKDTRVLDLWALTIDELRPDKKYSFLNHV